MVTTTALVQAILGSKNVKKEKSEIRRERIALSTQKLQFEI